jgi:hypothetical protein
LGGCRTIPSTKPVLFLAPRASNAATTDNCPPSREVKQERDRDDRNDEEKTDPEIEPP